MCVCVCRGGGYPDFIILGSDGAVTSNISSVLAELWLLTKGLIPSFRLAHVLNA